MELFDIVQPSILSTYVKDLPEPPGVRLNEILPDRLFNDIEAVFDEVSRTNRAAKFRAFDAETPIGKRDSLARKHLEMLPLGQKTVVGEYERLKLAQLQGANTDRLVSAIYDDVAVNANAARIRMELARGDVLTDGILSINENGVIQTYDYGVPAANTMDAAITWATATTDIPADLMSAMDLWVDAGGDDNPIMWVSRTTLRHMLANDDLRNLAQTNGVLPVTLNNNNLNQVMEAQGLPEIRVYNSSFDVDGATTRAIPIDIAIITPRNPGDLGFTAWGISAEALELVDAQRIAFEDAPGLVAAVYRNFDPVAVWTKVGGVGLPVITNPNRLIAINTVP